MQNCGITESDTNLKSCIPVYIQNLKNNQKIIFQKSDFSKSYGPFIFRCLSHLNVYNSKNTEPIKLKFTHNIRVGPVSVLGNFILRPFNIFAIIDLFRFSQIL